MKRFVCIILVGLLLLTILSSCSGVSGTTETTQGQQATTSTTTAATSATTTDGEKKYVNDTEVLNLDWFAAIGTDSKFESPYRVISSLYPHMLWGTLLKLDPYNVTDYSSESVIYDLAKSMTVSEDGLMYTFEIRDDVKWTDGAPFTAEDVRFSYELQLKIVYSMYGANMMSIKGAKDVREGIAETCEGLKAEGNKFIVMLDVPYIDIVSKMFANIQILPSHLLGDVDPIAFEDDLDFWTRPIGTGPWMIDQVSFPNYFTMAPNPDYYGEPVNIKNITFTSHVTGGVDATLADLVAGNLDYVFGNGVNDIKQAENVVSNNPDMQIFTRPSSYQRMLVFNGKSSNDGLRNEFMDNKLVRQAVNLLIDKVAVAAMYGDAATAMSTAVLPRNEWYNKDIPTWKRDAAKAKELLDQAGYDYKKAIRIAYYYNEQTTKDIMDILVQNFAEVGITLAPFLATGNLDEILYNIRNWDILYVGYLTSNPIYIYDMLLPSKPYDRFMGDTEFRETQFVPLFNSFVQEAETAARLEIAEQIQEFGLENCYQIPIYGLSRITIVNTQKLEFDQQIFKTDEVEGAAWLWQTWNLISYK